MEKTTCRIALLGLGTVGSGVLKTLAKHKQLLSAQTGIELAIGHILVRDVQKERGFSTEGLPLTDDIRMIENDPDIQIVIEVMGGIEPAKTWVVNSLKQGRHVITANKELMAKHGRELLELANHSGARILYEASVAGGIPIIHTLQKYLRVNQVKSITGILNGTCNYILTQMTEYGREYQEALQNAKEKGYAEADPSSDVEGFDTAYKLAILSALAFGIDVSVDQIDRQGIKSITSTDIRLAREMGYVIKLIGQAGYDGQSIALQVGPHLLPFDHSLARVDDVFNAVSIITDVVGELTFIGRGAGQFPTASAVVEDVLAILSSEPQFQPNRSQPQTEIATQKCDIISPFPCEEYFVRLTSTSLVGLERIKSILMQKLQLSGGRILDWKREHERVYTHVYRISGTNRDELRNLISIAKANADCSLDVNILPINQVAMDQSLADPKPDQLLDQLIVNF